VEYKYERTGVCTIRVRKREIDIDEIAIGHGEAFTPEGHAVPRAEETSTECLEMATG